MVSDSSTRLRTFHLPPSDHPPGYAGRRKLASSPALREIGGPHGNSKDPKETAFYPAPKKNLAFSVAQSVRSRSQSANQKRHRRRSDGRRAPGSNAALQHGARVMSDSELMPEAHDESRLPHPCFSFKPSRWPRRFISEDLKLTERRVSRPDTGLDHLGRRGDR